MLTRERKNVKDDYLRVTSCLAEDVLAIERGVDGVRSRHCSFSVCAAVSQKEVDVSLAFDTLPIVPSEVRIFDGDTVDTNNGSDGELEHSNSKPVIHNYLKRSLSGFKGICW